MNIEKLAKHLKEFTLDEINMIAEFDCKTELEPLLNTHKISFEQGVYRYLNQKLEQDYILCIKENKNLEIIDFQNGITYFLENYVKNNCKFTTYRRYRSILKYHIYQFFKEKNINDVTNSDIQKFYYHCKNRNLPPKVIKNILALLNQMITYFQNLGIIKCNCNFQVRRLTSKNEFSMNRIIFEGE